MLTTCIILGGTIYYCKCAVLLADNQDALSINICNYYYSPGLQCIWNLGW